MIVLDASVAVSWLFNEGPTPRLDSILAAHDIIVPSHWTVEVDHGILKALRRKTISQEHLSGIASDLDALSISVEPPIDVAFVFPLLHPGARSDNVRCRVCSACAEPDRKARNARQRHGQDRGQAWH